MNIKSKNRDEYLTNLINYANYLYKEKIPERENIEYLSGILHRTIEHFKDKDIDDPHFEASLMSIKKAYNQLKSKLDSLN